MAPRIGCQTYTWEMLGERWQGRPEEESEYAFANPAGAIADNREDIRSLGY